LNGPVPWFYRKSFSCAVPLRTWPVPYHPAGDFRAGALSNIERNTR
jgi:hypothetical protein